MRYRIRRSVSSRPFTMLYEWDVTFRSCRVAREFQTNSSRSEKLEDAFFQASHRDRFAMFCVFSWQSCSW